LVRNTSLKSTGSVEGLTRVGSEEQNTMYNGFDPETGKDGRFAIMQVEVKSHAQRSWRL
jgi:hypothetical protein